MAMMSMDVDTIRTSQSMVKSSALADMQKQAEAQQAQDINSYSSRQDVMRRTPTMNQKCLPARFYYVITATSSCCTVSGGTRCGHGHDGDGYASRHLLFTHISPASLCHRRLHHCSKRRHYRQGTGSHQHACSTQPAIHQNAEPAWPNAAQQRLRQTPDQSATAYQPQVGFNEYAHPHGCCRPSRDLHKVASRHLPA